MALVPSFFKKRIIAFQSDKTQIKSNCTFIRRFQSLTGAGYVYNRGKPIGNIGRQVTGDDADELMIDFAAKKITVTKVRGQSLTSAIPESFTTPSNVSFLLHLFLLS